MKFNFFFFLLLINVLQSQTLINVQFVVSDDLKENANSVVLNQQINIEVVSQNKVVIKKNKTILVYNELGLKNIDAIEFYDKSTKINSFEASLYSSLGKKIRQFKDKDFNDRSAADGFSIYNDNRVTSLNFTPTEYPFVIVFKSEIQSSNTAFIPTWYPIDDFYESVVKSEISISFPDNLGFKYKEINFQEKKIIKTETKNSISFLIENIPAYKKEEYAPDFQNLVPKVLFGLEKFSLEGVEGVAKTWEEFGFWINTNLLQGLDEVSDETQNKIKNLVGTETDITKKAKIIYKYVQDKVRYVSVQMGIGGWKPMPAKDVDRLGYGDCKALSNYTKALLKVVEIPSYYTIINAGESKKDIDSSFVSMQGNHAVLTIPNKNEYIFLECTSQEDPFGYQGTFTDDRNVLVVKPKGGEIVRTKVYSDKGNSQISKGSYSLSDKGDLLGSVVIESEGSQYSRKFGIEKMATIDKENYYKEYWDNINNLKILKATFLNDKEKISFIENVDVSAENYGNISANRMMFAVNVYNKYNSVVKKIRNRKNEFEIQRGYYDDDEIEMNLPENFIVEASPNNVELKTKFGEYKTEIVVKGNNKLIYKRTMLINKGLYSKTEYDEYRLFMEQVNRNDNSKIILIKNN